MDILYLVENGTKKTEMNEALIASAKKGHLKIVQYLIEMGANVRTKKDLALLSASKKHLEVGADIHAKDDQALTWSAENGRLEIVKYLVENGANIHAKDNWGTKKKHKIRSNQIFSRQRCRYSCRSK